MSKRKKLKNQTLTKKIERAAIKQDKKDAKAAAQKTFKGALRYE